VRCVSCKIGFTPAGWRSKTRSSCAWICQPRLLLDVHDLGLVPNWANDIALTRSLGDEWLQRVPSLGLWVPSFVEPLERNLLLNPMHPQYALIELSVERNPFEFEATPETTTKWCRSLAQDQFTGHIIHRLAIITASYLWGSRDATKFFGV